MTKYLIDTHIFIWVTCEAKKLPKTISKILANDNHKIYLSMATVWEMQIKYQLGKLPLTMPLSHIIDDVIKNDLYQLLPINERHILNLQNLDYFHKDPFDRMLISQAMCDKLTLLTVDEDIIKYPIKFIN